MTEGVHILTTSATCPSLGLLMRALYRAGTPKEAAAIRNAFLFVFQAAKTAAILAVTKFDADAATLIIGVAPDSV
jgi:transposase